MCRDRGLVIMSSTSQPGLALYTIPAQRAFADALVAGLMRRFGGDPMRLARGLVLPPHNRGRGGGGGAVRPGGGGGAGAVRPGGGRGGVGAAPGDDRRSRAR